MPLYLAWLGAEAEIRPALAAGEAVAALEPRLYLIDSARTQSRLYHAIKRELPRDTPLLVAALAGEPKFKGMAAGSLKWLRSRASG
ncbi:MAG: hypothetical protein WD100_02530 [Tistlia sp.]|uniref:hypothetical protein n=1 Tax=Tistlia sp. TaxID=3057121 RepID=UPI0034A27CA1